MHVRLHCFTDKLRGRDIIVLGASIGVQSATSEQKYTSKLNAKVTEHDAAGRIRNYLIV